MVDYPDLNSTLQVTSNEAVSKATEDDDGDTDQQIQQEGYVDMVEYSDIIPTPFESSTTQAVSKVTEEESGQTQPQRQV